MPPLQFAPVVFPEGCDELRLEVREFIAKERESGSLADQSGNAEVRGFNRAFSRRMGEKGWIGLMWPKSVGGQERSALERYVINEELLVARAPTTAHFVAERQSGPLLIRFGTDAHRAEIIPRIMRGECTFCIGMSEPNSGSDLASVQTSGTKVDGGWRVSGTKLWTSWAHKADYMITLVRTSPRGEDRHQGLSQLLVDMKSPGLEVRPIIHHSGSHHFNEVILDECFVPEEMLIGKEGDGWAQVNSELGYERSGPERFLSTFALFVELCRAVGPNPTDYEAAVIGRLTSHLFTLRNLSVSVAGMLQEGLSPKVEASVVKDLGTHFEKEIPELARQLIPANASTSSADPFERALADALLLAPQLTIQGGTREILRIIIARGIGLT